MEIAIMTVLALAAGECVGWIIWKSLRAEHRIRRYINS